MATTNPSFMNGVPELLVLRLLRGRAMYGYEIVQAIREETGEVVSLGEGVVYPVLHALERAGAITSERRPVGGRSRIYYALSPKGESRLTELTQLWSRITGAVQQVLAGGGRAGLV
jgi:PadR family transcriptional regulator PadR